MSTKRKMYSVYFKYIYLTNKLYNNISTKQQGVLYETHIS